MSRSSYNCVTFAIPHRILLFYQVRWLGPKNYFHYYWGGSKGKTDHCRCGIYNNCTDTSKYCNCDARSEKEATDEGFLTNKKHLPMKKIEFLDVNSNAGSKGRFSVGPLSCSGDGEIFPLMPKHCDVM